MLEQPGAGELRVGSGSFSYVDVLVKPKVKATVRKVLRGDPKFVGCDCTQAPHRAVEHTEQRVYLSISVSHYLSAALSKTRAPRATTVAVPGQCHLLYSDTVLPPQYRSVVISFIAWA